MTTEQSCPSIVRFVHVTNVSLIQCFIFLGGGGWGAHSTVYNIAVMLREIVTAGHLLVGELQ